ncbi:organic cation transporter protein [Elysia marginata]|uniref:Organic cation transporter protein n=1 Tax=Elysia marginata TaxID=1093978 RepID=A0AAV4GGK8_9GAST|nr:organic cation transporter protein [Elysia marginata]
MGRYQAYLFVLSVVASSNAGIHIFNVVFTMGMSRFRCAVPGLENDTFTIQDETHAKLVDAAIPFDSHSGGYSRCTHFKTSLSDSTFSVGNFTSSDTETCTRWVYSTEMFTSSIVSEARTIFKSRAEKIGIILKL